MLDANFDFYTFFKPRTEIGPPAEHRPEFDYGTADAYDFFLQMGPLSNANRLYLKGSNPYWNDNLLHTTYDDYWKIRNIAADVKNVRCAVLTVAGWFDSEDLAGPFKIFRAVASFNPGTSNRLVVGPWVHGGWVSSAGNQVGDVHFAGKPSEFYNEHILWPFFREHLKDAGDAKLPKAHMFETGTDVWRRYEEWPPKTEARTLYLHAGGLLSFKPPSQASAAATAEVSAFDEYVSDPNRPVPFLNSPALEVPRTYMTADQRFAAKRPDALVYQTAPLEEDVAVAGGISPHLWVSSSGTDSDFVVKVIDVYPQDYPDPQPNPREVKMGGYEQLVRGEPFRAKFRNSFEKPEPLRPNEATPLNFALPDIHYSFRRSHRIMVQIQSSWFPLVDRNPQKFMNIPDAKESDFQKATERVYHSKQAASAIVLPVPH